MKKAIFQPSFHLCILFYFIFFIYFLVVLSATPKTHTHKTVSHCFITTCSFATDVETDLELSFVQAVALAAAAPVARELAVAL